MNRIIHAFTCMVAVAAHQQRSTANPVRKVVTMLQSMQAKVTAEGKHQAELFEKFSCYCKKNGVDLSTSIEAGTNQIEALNVGLKTDTEKRDQTKASLAEHMSSRDEAKSTMAQATELRKKEAAAFGKVKSDSLTNLAALRKAIPAIEKGMFGSFLQTPAAAIVRKFAMEKADLTDNNRNDLLSFLSGQQNEEYIPRSGEIVGILKTIQDEMTAGLDEASAAENSAIQNYNALMAAKKKEVATLQKQIEVEMTRVGQLEVKLAGMGNDLVDTQEALAADNAFKADLETSCAAKAAQWDQIQKTRTEELLALAETIKTLNDDDALELFKKTLPGGSSLMQVQERALTLKSRALVMIQEARRGAQRASMPVQPQLDLISLALKGKQAGFDKVVKMIDNMVVNLKAEQNQDDNKKEYCNAQLDQAEDKHKVLTNSISDSEGAIDEMSGRIARLKSEIDALTAGIKALDSAVADATELRKKENADHKDLMTSDTSAKELLKWAQNRLRKFYEPALYKPPPEANLSEEERITVNFGGTLSTTPAGGIAGTGIGFVQVGSHKSHRAAPGPPPETFGPYSTKGGESRGVIAMIDVLIKDLDKEMQESTVNEKNAQEEYEAMMAESATKRTKDSKSVTDKTLEKAATQEALEAEKEAKAGTTKELMGTSKYISSLHADCDWFLQYFEARKMARAGEVESLKNAKAVLNGADYSLVQQKTVSRHFMARTDQ